MNDVEAGGILKIVLVEEEARSADVGKPEERVPIAGLGHGVLVGTVDDARARDVDLLCLERVGHELHASAISSRLSTRTCVDRGRGPTASRCFVSLGTVAPSARWARPCHRQAAIRSMGARGEQLV